MRRSLTITRFSPFLIGGRGEIVGAEIDPRRRLVEVDHGELVMHARAAAAGRLGLEGFRHVGAEFGGKHRRDIAAGVLHVEAADVLVGNAVDEDVLVGGDGLDGVEDDAWRFVEKGERVEQR